jgi:pyruvate,orthophosphate dikinase
MRFVSDFQRPPGDTAGDLGTRDAALRALCGFGAPVPPGFAISDLACRRFVETGDFPEGMWEQVVEGIERIDRSVAALDPDRPPLLAVRSSAPVDMPGLMGAALYLGLTPASMDRLTAWAGPEAAARTRLSFLRTYGKVIRGVPAARVDGLLASPTEGAAGEDMEALGDALEALIAEESQRPIPDDRLGQVREGIEAVFASWDARPASDYRRSRGIPAATGTAAIVHLMVFGDLGPESGVGVGFSRDPLTGEPGITGRYRDQAAHPTTTAEYEGLGALSATDPACFAQLMSALSTYESERLDLVRLDFVRERARLWIVDGRVADRAAEAATRIAVDLVAEGALSKQDALRKLDPSDIADMLHPRPAPGPLPAPAAHGGGASPGWASGMVFLDSAAALDAAATGTPVILVKRETSPEDIDAIRAADGVLTSHGGRASHATLVARGIGTPAVTGSHNMLIDVDQGVVSWGDVLVRAGDTITIDGRSGNIYRGEVSIIPAGASASLTTILEWADEVRRMEIWANADTPGDAARARAAGAEGIGLARTEYMFSGDRLGVVQRILLTTDPRDQAEALEQLERLQVGDFERLLEVMDGLPVVVRLLDPPLHEFLPDRLEVEHEIAAARLRGEPTDELELLEAALDKWEESNPMLGLRGVRLAVVIPAVYKVQVLAALEAVRRRLDAGGDPRLELMIPLVGTVEELHLIRDMIEEEVHHAGRLLEVAIGTMIELPRAALVAADIALDSDFLSFGTNDLTQTTMGLSRDDAEEAFLGQYIERGLFRSNPFETIDRMGVGRLIQLAIAEGRDANPGLIVGVCGEHGADPDSIEFFHDAGVDYVSCSPPRIPVARLAAARAALRAGQ